MAAISAISAYVPRLRLSRKLMTESARYNIGDIERVRDLVIADPACVHETKE